MIRFVLLAGVFFLIGVLWGHRNKPEAAKVEATSQRSLEQLKLILRDK